MRTRFSAFAAIAALSGALMYAQGPGFGRGGPGAGRGRGGAQVDPQQMVSLRVDRMATLLSLTDSQKQQATTIFDNAYKATEGQRTSLTQAQQALMTAAKANQPASEIDTLAADVGSLVAGMRATGAKAFAAFWQILTLEQRTKLDQLCGSGMCGAGMRGAGGAGGGFGPGFGGSWR
jgi:Spy/CpxP family protein refolding chaperone